MKSKRTTSNAPICIFCKRHGEGVQFAIFGPRFKPFGTACVECEEKIPAHITSPEQWTPEAQAAAAVTANESAERATQFQTALAALLAAIKEKAESQFAYNEKENIPRQIIEASESVAFALSHGMASGWNTVNGWSCDHAIDLAHQILEDANCHTEAARIAPQEEAVA